jgi:hypothetical protein
MTTDYGIVSKKSWSSMKFYRYETYQYEYDPELFLKEFDQIKETPCGWWIGTNSSFLCLHGDRRKWASKTARKRYAYPTKKEALVNFKARKHRQIQILKAQLLSAETELNLIKDIIKKERLNGL